MIIKQLKLVFIKKKYIYLYIILLIATFVFYLFLFIFLILIIFFFSINFKNIKNFFNYSAFQLAASDSLLKL